MNKKCCTCKEYLPLESFYLCKTNKDGIHHKCKKCKKKEPYNKEYFKKYREANKEKKAFTNKKYRENNKEKIKLHKASDKYKKIKSTSDKKYYEKVKLNPSLLIAMRIRTMISECANNKNRKTFDILGYNKNDLVLHLENKFTDNMSWNNYGKKGWHIDHIKPLALFDLTKEYELKEAFSLSNLQPLWASDNCSKGSLYNGKRYYKK
jgi:hypothetical protein